jgi:hypothetical protein
LPFAALGTIWGSKKQKRLSPLENPSEWPLCVFLHKNKKY